MVKHYDEAVTTFSIAGPLLSGICQDEGSIMAFAFALFGDVNISSDSVSLAV